MLDADCLEGSFSEVIVEKNYANNECDEVRGEQDVTSSSSSSSSKLYLILSTSDACGGSSNKTKLYVAIGVSIGTILLLAALLALVLLWAHKKRKLGRFSRMFWSVEKSRDMWMMESRSKK